MTNKYVEDFKSYWMEKEKIDSPKDIYTGISDSWFREYMNTYPHPHDFKYDLIKPEYEEKPKAIQDDVLVEELKRRGVTIVGDKTEMD